MEILGRRGRNNPPWWGYGYFLKLYNLATTASVTNSRQLQISSRQIEEMQSVAIHDVLK